MFPALCFKNEKKALNGSRESVIPFIGVMRKLFSALQIIFLFFLHENELRKALIPFIGV